jgi:hypothetical protein
MPTRPKTRRKVVRPRSGTSTKLRRLAAELRKFANSFDGVTEEYPWGERVVKGPNGKVFAFLGDPYLLDGHLCFTVKLPTSRRDVLKLPFAKPCGYGLGKHGWVTLKFAPGDAPAVKTMRGWIAESYDAVNGGAGASPPKRESKAGRKRAPR